ncbi:MAG: hypothetical protein H7Y43_13725, partial [Akkermansiaceae bacterium]|nr:hypothetical protein [Verrucomicrobiales bacterium]
DSAISHLQKAVETEDSLPYMEPAFWPVPSRPALGVVLLRSGKADEAEKVFRQDLQIWPRNGWSLLGLEKSLRAQGHVQLADSIQREFTASWKRADVNLDLAWF